MNEPSLKDMSDYKTLEGQKKRVVFAVILAGLVIGVIYTIASKIYNGPEDVLVEQHSYKYIPMK